MASPSFPSHSVDSGQIQIATRERLQIVQNTFTISGVANNRMNVAFANMCRNQGPTSRRTRREHSLKYDTAAVRIEPIRAFLHFVMLELLEIRLVPSNPRTGLVVLRVD